MIARNNPDHALGRTWPGSSPSVSTHEGGTTEELILCLSLWIIGLLVVFMPLSIRLYSKLT